MENAILHGIEKKKEMGRIQIQAIVREGTLEIRVTDDGIGMQPDRLMRFRRVLFQMKSVESILNAKCTS